MTTSSIGNGNGSLHDPPSAADELKDALPRYNAINESDATDSSANNLISIDDAIDRIDHGTFQTRILISAGLSFAADAMEVTLLSFLSAVLKSKWDLTRNESATVTSSVFAGAMLGTLILGPLGDVWGRRPVFLVGAVMISFFGFGTVLAWGYYSLLAMRFMVGFGIGGLTVPFDIYAEFLPTDHRGQHLMAIWYFWTGGSLLVPALAYFTFGYGRSWQIFVLLCAMPCLLSAIAGYFFVPESPRWLVSRHRYDEALDILRNAATVNGKDPHKVFPPGTHFKPEPDEGSSFSELFKPEWRNLTLLLWGVWFGFSFAYYGTILAITRVFEDDAGGTEMYDDDSYDIPTFNFQAIFISCTAELVGITVILLTVDKLGRISTQAAFYALGGLCVYMLCRPSIDSDGTLTFISFCARICEMAASCLTWVTTAEVLSTEIRTTGHSAANAVARIGGFLCPYLVEGKTTLATVGMVMVVVHAFAVACVAFLPETKGKSLGFHEPPRRLSSRGHEQMPIKDVIM